MTASMLFQSHGLYQVLWNEELTGTSSSTNASGLGESIVASKLVADETKLPFSCYPYLATIWDYQCFTTIVYYVY